MMILALLFSYVFASTDTGLFGALTRHGYVDDEGNVNCMGIVQLKKCGELRTFHDAFGGVDYCAYECNVAAAECLATATVAADCAHHQKVTKLFVKMYTDDECKNYAGMCAEINFSAKDQCSEVGNGVYKWVNPIHHWKCKTQTNCESQDHTDLALQEDDNTDAECVISPDNNGPNVAGTVGLGTHNPGQCVALPNGSQYYTRDEMCPTTSAASTCTVDDDDGLVFLANNAGNAALTAMVGSSTTCATVIGQHSVLCNNPVVASKCCVSCAGRRNRLL